MPPEPTKPVETPAIETPPPAGETMAGEDADSALMGMDDEAGDKATESTPEPGQPPPPPPPEPPPPVPTDTPKARDGEPPVVTPPEPPKLLAGKYKTPEDLEAAHTALQTKLGEQGAQLAELQNREPDKASVDAMIARGDYEGAARVIASVREGQEKSSTNLLAEMAVDPKGTIRKIVAEDEQERQQAEQLQTEYEGKVKAVYEKVAPGQWDGFSDARAEILNLYKDGKIGAPQLLHLAAIGNSVINGGVTEVREAPGEIQSAETLAGGAPIVNPDTPDPQKGKSEEDLALADMNEMGDPGSGPMF